MTAAQFDEAVKAGIVTAEQAERLATFLAAREASCDPAMSSEDERFRLFNGFNDVFLALGVALVSAACFSQTGMRDANLNLVPNALGALLAWVFAELLVARHRSLLPGIVACASFALFSGILARDVLVEPLGELLKSAGPWRPDGIKLTLFTAGAFCAASLFFARFRFPFAVLIAGGSAAAGVMSAAFAAFGASATRPVYSLTLVAGLALFALAMRFDASDTARQTRRSDCGFWLHLAAAPFVVYPLIALTTGGFARESASNAIAVLAIGGLLALVALVVDRRALLVSSLLSLGVAIGYLIRTAAIPSDAAVTVTLGVLGVLVVVMGLGWQRLRAAVLSPFRNSPLLALLPPVHP